MTVLSDFIASVKEWIDDADPTDSLVTQCVRLAETRINNELRSDVQIVRMLATFDDACAILPNDWLQTVYVRPQGGRPFDYITNHDYWNLAPVPSPYQTPLPPEDVAYPFNGYGRYTHIGRTLFIWPKVDPEALIKMEVAYYQMVAPIDVQGNPVFSRYPDLYLNCTLAALAPYLIEDERLQTFSALSTAQIKMANDSSTIARFSGSPLPPVRRSFG